MGLFLQKTNIIRDIFEDVQDLDPPRVFWPREAFAPVFKPLLGYESEEQVDITDLMLPEHLDASVSVLNSLVRNALGHIPDCFDYLGRIKHAENFKFCAIPQVMAVATLAACYNNPDVIQGVVSRHAGPDGAPAGTSVKDELVKIRRSLTTKIMLTCENVGEVAAHFSHFLEQIDEKAVEASDYETCALVKDVLAVVKPLTKTSWLTTASVASVWCSVGVGAWYYLL